MSNKAEREVVYIYRIYFPSSGKSYIGQTNNIVKRMVQHVNNRKKNLIGYALNKHDDWKVLNLHVCCSRDEANKVEIEEIRNFKSIAPNGYNLADGGRGTSGLRPFLGKQHSDIWKANQSKRMRGENNPMKRPEVRAKVSESNKGMRQSDKHYAKLSKLMIGEKNPAKRPEVRAKISASLRGNRSGVGARSKDFCNNQRGENNPMNRPGVRAKHSAAMRDPRMIAKRSLATRRNQAKKLELIDRNAMSNALQLSSSDFEDLII